MIDHNAEDIYPARALFPVVSRIYKARVDIMV